ncbi:MAG TPA: IclR family transcriptional regulator [Burkholderiales bacterium]|jgi:DNA-binding IclR family transcriptional regulator|nr:IclR family transcriptional regulator [Burkholderiales bacterium]
MEISGTQSIHRAIVLLRAIASRGRAGSRLLDLAKHARLTPPTAHRILRCLVEENIVAQDPDTHRYLLGHLVFELGLAAAPQFNLRQIVEPSLRRVAEKTGDTAFLIARSGFDTVCLDRQEGAFPIKALTLDVGTRRPLGVGAGGMALLLSLPDDEIERIVAANGTRLKDYGRLNVPIITGMIARGKQLGYALNDRQETPGVISVGLPVSNRYGPPYAAISVGAISSRMSAERQKEIAAIVKGEVRSLEKRLAEAVST